MFYSYRKGRIAQLQLLFQCNFAYLFVYIFVWDVVVELEIRLTTFASAGSCGCFNGAKVIFFFGFMNKSSIFLCHIHIYFGNEEVMINTFLVFSSIRKRLSVRSPTSQIISSPQQSSHCCSLRTMENLRSVK